MLSLLLVLLLLRKRTLYRNSKKAESRWYTILPPSNTSTSYINIPCLYLYYSPGLYPLGLSLCLSVQARGQSIQVWWGRTQQQSPRLLPRWFFCSWWRSFQSGSVQCTVQYEQHWHHFIVIFLSTFNSKILHYIKYILSKLLEETKLAGASTVKLINLLLSGQEVWKF